MTFVLRFRVVAVGVALPSDRRRRPRATPPHFNHNNMPYQTGLCGCMEDTGSCIDSLCCQCCQVGRQYKAADGEVNQLSVPHCLCFLCFPTLVGAVLRCKISTALTLEENVCVSCCVWVFCPQCATCQQHRQLTLSARFPGGMCVSQPYTDKIMR